jgi:predicted HTH transcriptional regulator
MLFADRLEVWNPGILPPSLTLEKLRKPHQSVPHNPLLAEPMYLTKYIERMGTGTRDMILRCRETELPEPEFAVSTGIFTTTIRRKVSIDTSITGQVPGKYRASTGQVPGKSPDKSSWKLSVPACRVFWLAFNAKK